jgi:hypothetical protein
VSSDAPKQGRIAQIRTAYSVTKKADPRIGWILLGIVLLATGVGVGVGLLLDSPVLWGVLGFTVGLLTATIVFGRRAERSAMRQIEGQTGAAAAVLGTLRKGWTVTPGVAATRSYEVVHRVVGPPGVVLVGEGNPGRVSTLIKNEVKRTARVVGPDVPIHEVVVGDTDGAVPLGKLNRHVMKLGRTLRGPQVSDVLSRLRAMPSMQQPAAMPKGPIPKGAKLPRPPKR